MKNHTKKNHSRNFIERTRDIQDKDNHISIIELEHNSDEKT